MSTNAIAADVIANNPYDVDLWARPAHSERTPAKRSGASAPTSDRDQWRSRPDVSNELRAPCP
eukprot:4874093-Prymnesium_polylepis.1